MIQQFAVRAKSQTVCDLDAFPQLGYLSRWIDAKERPGARRALEVKGVDIHAEGPAPNASLIIDGEVVYAEQWFAVPVGKDVS